MDRYEIRVAGHLDQRRARFLGCDELRLLPGGDSLLVLRAADQAAIYGLLTRLRDAGVELIAAERRPADARTAVSDERARERSKEHPDATG